MNKIVGNSNFIAILPTVILATMVYLFTGDVIFSVCISTPLGITLAVASYEQRRMRNYGFSSSLSRTQAIAWLGFGLFLLLFLMMLTLKT